MINAFFDILASLLIRLFTAKYKKSNNKMIGFVKKILWR